jgi:hypothetical protein
MTNFLTLRNSPLSTLNALNLNYSTLTGSTLTSKNVQFSTLTGSTLINTVISTNTVIATSTVTGSIGIFHNSLGAAAPTVGISGGAGERLILWPGTSATYPYSIGINGGTLWYSVPSGAQHNWYVGGVSAMVINSSGYVGIGTTNSSSSLLHLHSTSDSIHRATSLNIYTSQAGIVLDSTQSGGRSWNIWSEKNAGSNPRGLNIYDSTVGEYRFTINSSGNVGIGTVNAERVLSIYNTVGGYSASIFVPSTYANYMTFGSGTTPYAIIGHDNSTGGGLSGSGVAYGVCMGALAAVSLSLVTSNVIRMTILTNGNVGIGTVNPISLLHVSAAAGYTGTVTNVSNFANTPSIILQSDISNANHFIYMGSGGFGGGGATGFVMWRGDSYDTYIQVRTSTVNANVAGSLNAAGPYVTSGGTSWASSSDIRLKENWKSIDNVIKKLSSLTTGTFQWIAMPEVGRIYGLIAQEVEKVFPEMISTDSKGYLGVQYTEMIPVLVKAVQELSKEQNLFINQIQQQQLQINQLIARLEKANI